MIVVKSKISGYCHGVNNTIRYALAVIKKANRLNVPAYSIGELIHNNDVVEGFSKQGLKVIYKPDCEPGVALVRAHGIPEKLKREFEEKNFTLVDSTCDNIIKTKNAIVSACKDNRTIVVVGVKNHAESNTLLGVNDTEKFLISSVSDLKNLYSVLPADSRVAVAVQTTFSEEMFSQISDSLKEHYPDVVFLNNLCAACTVRKSLGLRVASECDAVVVVGGSASSNTKELANWIERAGKPVYLIENVGSFNRDLDSKMKEYGSVGVCSGTSTPAVVIDAVCRHLEEL